MLDTAANPERITSSALGLEPRVQYILLGFITIETFSYINVEPSPPPFINCLVESQAKLL